MNAFRGRLETSNSWHNKVDANDHVPKNEHEMKILLYFSQQLVIALLFPWQAAGAVGGALAIVEVMPMQYKHMLGGPSLKVDLHTGALAEGVLTFIITFAVLFIVLKGPRSPLLKTWLISMSTVVMIVTGSSYTGPSMNPANVSTAT